MLTALTAPSMALAHGGHEHFSHHSVFHAKQVQHFCAEAGVALNGHSDFNRQGRRPSSLTESGPGSLTETQVKELKMACEKLATAYGVERTADEAAAKTLWEALKPARAKLLEACPALTEHHDFHVWMHAELSPACTEALTSYWATAREAKKSFRAALEAAGKPFEVALKEFEASTESILPALEAAQAEHSSHHGKNSDGPGSPGFSHH